MSSTLAVSLHEHDRNHEPRNSQSAVVTPTDNGSLSPHIIHHHETPGASTSGLSCYPSDFSDYEEDPFFGADLSNPDEGLPSFLQENLAGWEPSPAATTSSANVEPSRYATDASYQPLTPDQTASIHTASPRSERRAVTRLVTDSLPPSISPQELQKPFKSESIVAHHAQLTPSQSSSCRSSEDGGLAPAPTTMPSQSPRVTVSFWDQGDNKPTHTAERSLDVGSSTTQGGLESAGDLISSSHGDQNPPTSAPRDAMGRWQPDPLTGQAGLDPKHRPSEEVTSLNDVAKQREAQEREREVSKWLANDLNELSVPREKSEDELQAIEGQDNPNDTIPFNEETRNRRIDGQTYYSPNGAPMNDQDYEIIAKDRNWANAPMVPEIRGPGATRYQPESSQAAIERFERMCRDTDSILSRQATWGTRRHSVSETDVEGIISGNFLKKLSISKNTDRSNKAGNLLRDLRGFVRRPSISSLRKRRSSNASDDGHHEDGPPLEKRDSTGSPHLAPPDRTSSWGKKNVPSLNTALVSMGSSVASVGNVHTRKSSVGAITSPSRGILGSLKVENTLQRPRSRSEVPKATTPDSAESHPAIIKMWKQTGGPPVAPLRHKPSTQMDPEDDDDDDEDGEDNDMKGDANLIDNVLPNFAGFRQHVLLLNPHMEGQNEYLADRIAHQQIVRYKSLLTNKVTHLKHGPNCPCGALCISNGGKANVLDSKGDAKGLDPLSTHFPDDEDGATPTDGAINQDSFPQDIPMPPTQNLPAEFECQLCFSRKKFTKPSDWTKHVHEDVQPFTCTWDRCRDAKSFKRKADWVRHENEGHRHLEWWTCDFDECRHTCYRRDNFLQHLVREHKYPEPKVKTKAALKKSGAPDPTWQKVEQCHVLTNASPQEEPCRFCGKTFPTWKKLTVHLAKHMEQISLPVLRLVAAKAREIDADYIISPVQDPPPRPVFPPTTTRSHAATMPFSHDQQMRDWHPAGVTYPNQGHYNMYPVMPPAQQYEQQSFYNAPYDNMAHTLQQPPMNVDPMNPGFGQSTQMQHVPAATSPYVQGSNQFMTLPSNNGNHNSNNDNGVEPFPSFDDGLGLHNAGGPVGNSFGYNGMMDPSTASASPYSAQGAASQMHSPNPNVNGMNGPWDDRHANGFI